jgi:8-oxo-dGTP pyrophosphatase MutT (NUDIX family)
MPWPKIRSRRTTAVSPWISIIAREVEFSRGARRELYHAVAQADYIAIVALTPEGKIPIVRQYRPALEAFSWELPAGLVDAGETPRACCRRELLEETGLTARSIHVLAHTFPCTGRLSNRIHSFFVGAGKRVSGFRPEPGVAVKLVTPGELMRMIRAGKFASQLHLGALMLAALHGFLPLPHGKKPRLSRARRSISPGPSFRGTKKGQARKP